MLPLAVPKWKRQRWKWLREELKDRNRKDEDEIERYKNRGERKSIGRDVFNRRTFENKHREYPQ